MVRLVLFFCSLYICGIHNLYAVSAPVHVQKLTGSSRPQIFQDDLNYKGLMHALTINEQYLRQLPPQKKLQIGNQEIPVLELLQTTKELKRIIALRPSSEQLTKLIHSRFKVLRVWRDTPDRSARPVLVTAYYQPVLQGSITPDETFKYPLYQIPDNLAIRRSSGAEDVQGQVGRLDQGTFVPYWTRGEIERDNLLEGQELVWLKDPIDAFSLHIQGSGLVELPDGRLRSIRYGLKNGQPYRSIGKYMVDTGRMLLSQASFAAIRSYLEQHPEEQEDILHHNQSYIFFRWSDTIEAIGSMGLPVSAGRTVAADKTIYPLGTIGFLTARMPQLRDRRVVGWKEMTRFVLVQDTGSAIQGANRLDFFLGRGPDAGIAAGRVKQQGAFYLLLLK